MAVALVDAATHPKDSSELGYAGALSALTHGHGRFTLEPDRYEPAP